MGPRIAPLLFKYWVNLFPAIERGFCHPSRNFLAPYRYATEAENGGIRTHTHSDFAEEEKKEQKSCRSLFYDSFFKRRRRRKGEP